LSILHGAGPAVPAAFRGWLLRCRCASPRPCRASTISVLLLARRQFRAAQATPGPR